MPVAADSSAVEVAFGLGGGPGQAPWWFAIGLIVLAVLALFPRETRTAVTGAWIIALAGLALGLVATVVSFSPYPDAPELSAWAGVPAALWLTGLSTAVLFAAPLVRMRRYRRWARPGIVLLLAFPLLSLGWLVGRGIDDPLTTQEPLPVPTYVAQMQVTSLVVTGDLDEGIVARVVSGSGRILGAEGMQPSDDRQDQLESAVQNVLSNPVLADVEELARLGVRVVYAPGVDETVERRFDAVPGLVTAGSESPTSRVWMVDVDVAAEPVPEAGVSRTVLGIVWVLAWLVVLALALPVRERQEDE